MWAVLKQLLSTNWLIKSAVKREVSLVSFRNFGFCRVRTNDMTCVLSYPEFYYGVCFAKFELSVIKWHGSRHFSFIYHRFCFDDKQGISLTTWMVVGETDKWNTNFQFFNSIFVVHHVEWELLRNGILLFWRKQIIPFVLIVFFWGHLFLWQRFISVQKTCCCRPSLMRCHKNRDVRSFGRD